MDLLTTSAQRAYRACPRLYRIQFEDGYRPLAAADPLAFGTLGHRGLEAWWLAAQRSPKPVECSACRGTGEGALIYTGNPDGEQDALPCNTCDGTGMVGGPEQWWSAALSAIDAATADDYQRARAVALMWGYHCRWADMTWDGQPITVLGVEVEFQGPLTNPDTGAASRTWERAGKLDALVSVGGRVYVVEHKTSGEAIGPGSDYWARLTMDSQVSNYVSGARLLGHADVAGVIYDVIRKPRLDPLKATPEEKRRYTKPTKAEPTPRLYAGQRAADETPEEFYQRLVDDLCGDDGSAIASTYARTLVVRLEAEEREAAADLWQTGAQIRDARRLNVWPRNPDACLRWGRRCGFWDACTGVASLDDPTRYRRAETPHEELTIARRHEAVAAE